MQSLTMYALYNTHVFAMVQLIDPVRMCVKT